MSTDIQSVLAGALIKPAIKRFVNDHPSVAATFRFQGENLEVHVYDVSLGNLKESIGDVFSAKPIAEVVFTPAQQYQACLEFLKVTGALKK